MDIELSFGDTPDLHEDFDSNPDLQEDFGIGVMPSGVISVNGKTGNVIITRDDLGAQETLVSGKNIKTINGNSLLGSGNLEISGGGTNDHRQLTNRNAPDQHPIESITGLGGQLNLKQDTLVSGENIKTINDQSILGTGNLNISTGTSDYTQLINKPSINNVTLDGDKTSAELSLASQASVTDINSKIPNQASSNNQLADKDFVNSSISTATATFRGTFTSLQTLQNTNGDRNDYAFYSHTDTAGNTIYDRYKYVGLPDSRVPAGYTEMLWLQKPRNATPYIDTGYKIQSTDKIYMKLYGWEYEATEYEVFGAIDSNNKYFRIQKQYLGEAALVQTSGGSVYAAQLYNGTAIIECYDGKVYRSDINGENKTLAGNLTLDTVDANLYLFAYNKSTDGTVTRYPQWVRIGDFIVYDQNDNKKLELVPCSDPLGNNGYYETVSGRFIGPVEGSGTFVAQGISADKWLFEYSLNNSSFTAAQWATINSGLTSQVATDINTINGLIPSQAGINNQLADKGYVESSISTATASFKGTFTSLTTLQATEGDRNDYAFYAHTDSSGNTVYDRYKYVGPKDVILPAGYTQVERISGNYINLNILPRNDWHFILKVSSPYFANWAPAVPVFGVQSGNTRYDMYKPSYEDPLFLKTTAGQWGKQVSNNDIHTIEVKSNRAMYIDGSLTATIGSTTNLPTTPVYLLGVNSNGSAWKQNNVYCYGLTIYDNEENLLMDLVPCIRDQDGSIGVYDLAGTINPDTNSPFYGGATSSAPLSEDKWEYEYSLNNTSFTSSQWSTINSGLAAHVTSNGYDASATQVLKNINGTLTWVTET